MIETHAGLPNSCTQCGKTVTTATWFAEHADAARAGKGYCHTCAKPNSTPTPITATTVTPPQTLKLEPVEPDKPRGKVKTK